MQASGLPPLEDLTMYDKNMLSINSRDTWSPDFLKKTNAWLGDKKGKYVSTFRAYEDIDTGGDPDKYIVHPLEVWADDIDTIVKAFTGYIRRNNLSHRNISSTLILKNDKIIAKIYYNGEIDYIGKSKSE